MRATDTVDPVGAILARHGIRDPWEPLTYTGVANRIYATRELVVRIATDHPEAVPDARTESVAAPVARAAGLPVPRLIAFDDSREITAGPYSIWERMHGETLGLHRPDPDAAPDTWRAVGRQLAKLHMTVTACADPNGWLDQPEHPDYSALWALAAAAAPRLGVQGAEIVEWLDQIEAPFTTHTAARRFLHYDVHDMNCAAAMDRSWRSSIGVMPGGATRCWNCRRSRFAQFPTCSTAIAARPPRSLGDAPEARILADQLWCGLEDLRDRGRFSRDIGELRQFVAQHQHRWR